MLDEFKKCLLEHIVVYLNEQKVPPLSEAAVLADEFALTHRSTFLTPGRQEMVTHAGNRKTRSPKNSQRSQVMNANHKCFYVAI